MDTVLSEGRSAGSYTGRLPSCRRPYGRGTQPGVKAWGAKLGIRLALTIHDRAQVDQQVRPSDLGGLPAAHVERIQTGEAGAQFVGAFPNREAASAQRALRGARATRAEFHHGPRHKQPAGAPLEGARRHHQESFEAFGKFHTLRESQLKPVDSFIFLMPSWDALFPQIP